MLHRCNAQPEAVPNSYAEGYEGINLKNTASKFNIAFKNDRLSEALRRTTTRQEYQDWKEITNVLLHRVTPPASITYESRSAVILPI